MVHGHANDFMKRTLSAIHYLATLSPPSTHSQVGSRVVVYGGERPSREPLSDAYILDLKAMAWTRADAGEGPGARAGHTAVRWGGAGKAGQRVCLAAHAHTHLAPHPSQGERVSGGRVRGWLPVPLLQ